MSQLECLAFFCSLEREPTKLMCPIHWELLRSDIKMEVYRSYKLSVLSGKHPDDRWFLTASTAQLCVLDWEVVNLYRDGFAKPGVTISYKDRWMKLDELKKSIERRLAEFVKTEFDRQQDQKIENTELQ